MTKEEIYARINLADLRETADEAAILALCDKAAKAGVASVCVAPQWVKTAKAHLGDKLSVTTLFGAPDGDMTTEEVAGIAKKAAEDGASEVIYTLNKQWFANKQYNDIINGFLAVRNAAGYGVKLEMNIESDGGSAGMTMEEKEIAVRMIGVATGDMVITTAAADGKPASLAEVDLLYHRVCAATRVEAGGTVATLAEAEALLNKGALRLLTAALPE